MPHMRPSTRAAGDRLGATWNAEIAALNRQLLEAKSRRNQTVASIYGLPPEILSGIFKLSQLTYDHVSFYDLGGSKPWRWYVVTHVCRHFRSIALADSSLWSNLDMKRAVWDEFLHRSRASPLNIKGFLESSRDHAGLRYLSDIRKNLSRIRSLDVGTRSSLVMEKLVSSLATSSPEFLSLRLSFTEGHLRLDSGMRSTLQHFISSSLRIQEVKLLGLGTSFPWAPLASTLTELTLDAGSSYHWRGLSESVIAAVAFTFDDVLGGLRAMPLLKFLSIIHVLPPLPPNLHTTRQPVSLPRLCDLSLTSFDSCSAYLWSLLEAPPHCRTNITSLLSDWARSQDYLLPRLVALMKHDEAPAFDSMEVCTHEETDFDTGILRRFTVSCGIIRPPWHYSVRREREPPTIRFSALHRNNDLSITDANILPPLIAVFPHPTNIRHVHIGDLSLTSDDFCALSGRATTVRTVHFDGTPGTKLVEFLRLLAKILHHDPDSSSSPGDVNLMATLSAPYAKIMSWPSLSSVHLDSLDLGPDDPESVWQALQAYMRFRSDSGYCIDKVVVNNCDLPMEWYVEWDNEKRLPKLEWDFIPGLYGTDHEVDSSHHSSE